MSIVISASSFTVEEISYIATVIDGINYKTRRNVIDDMRLCLPGNIVSDDERQFISKCVDKLEKMTDAEFNKIDFLSAWALENIGEE